MKPANAIVIFALWGALISLLGYSSTIFAFPDEAKFSFSVPNGAGELDITPNGRFMAVLSSTSAIVTIVDTARFQSLVTFSLPSQPTGVAAKQDSTAFYVTLQSEDGLFRIDLSGTPSEFTAAQLDLEISDAFIDAEVIGANLFLLDEDGTTVHVFDTELETVDPENSFTLTFSANELRGFENLSRIVALGTSGTVGVINPITFIQTGNSQNLSSFVSQSASFKGISGGLNQNGATVAFSANSSNPGEVVGYTVTSTTSPITVIDADPSTAERDPITVGNTPIDILYSEVIRPEDSALSSDFYLYVANQQDNTLSVVATEEFFDSDSEVVAPFTTIDLTSTPLSRGLAGNGASDSYIYVATAGNAIDVVTDNPVVTFTTPAPASVSSSTFTFGFTSDVGGSYDIRRIDLADNGAVTSSSGAALGSGTVTANVEVVLEIETDDLIEGDNLVVVFVNSDGRNGFSITASPPPAAPSDFSLGFGDQKIVVQFDSVEGDVESYNIYFGPAENSLTGISGLSSPISVDHPGEANQRIIENLEPISNGLTVYVQVAAVNAGGDEGARTEILFETTEETFGLLDVLGENGGCSQVKRQHSIQNYMLLLMVLALLVIARRRYQQ